MAEQPTVLMVYEGVGARESLRAILTPEYQVLIATDREQALHLVAQRLVGVVPLELRVLGLSGMQSWKKSRRSLLLS